MEFGKLYKVLMKMTDLKGKFDDEEIKIDGFTFRRLLKRSAEFGIKVYFFNFLKLLQLNKCMFRTMWRFSTIALQSGTIIMFPD